QSIRDFSPDVALDLMGNHKGGVLAALSLADRRIGWRRADRREPSSALWIRQGLPARGLHAVDRNLSLLAGLDLEVAPAAVDFGGALLPGTPPGGAEEPFVFLHPGAGWGNKRYRPEDWVAVAVGIHQRSGLRTLVAAGPG